MKSFKSFITEKLKVTNNNHSINDDDLEHIADMLSDYIEELARQNNANIEDIIDELKEYTVYNYFSYWNYSVEEFIQYFNNNSVKKYNEKELENIITDYDNELTEKVVIYLNR
jgi:hypothetical protein